MYLGIFSIDLYNKDYATIMVRHSKMDSVVQKFNLF